jgi:twinkle protein
MAKIVKAHTGCKACGSSDALCEYEGGSTYCFSCKKYSPSVTDLLSGKNNSEFKPPEEDVSRYGRGDKLFTLIEQSDSGPIKSRKISQEVTSFFGVRISYDENRNDIKHAYPYEVDRYGVAQAYKIRGVVDKRFSSIGKIKGFCGQHLFPAGGKRLVITEGEIDMLSVAQASLEKYGKIYPVISVRSATTIADDMLANRDWIRSFDEVIYCKDNDARGEESAAHVSRIVGVDKVKIATFGKYKDPNEVLVKEGFKEVLNRIWDAQHIVPAGIITKEDLWTALCSYNDIESVPYPSCVEGLNDKLKGLREGEIDLFISGTGAGKSTLFRELVLNLRARVPTSKIGIISLEEAPAETARRLSGMQLCLNTAQIDVPIETLKEGFDQVFGDDNILLLDHQGSAGDSMLLDLIEYMALMGCKYIFLDHITLAVSEGIDNLTGNEAVDSLMSSLLKLVKRHGFWLGIISHLRKSPSMGKSFEEGVMPNLDSIKGSGSIKQISFGVIAFSRDQGNPDPIIRSTINFSVLKNRYTGLTGPIPPAFYNINTGRLQAAELSEEFERIPSKEYDEESEESKELAIEQLAFESACNLLYIE